MLLCGTASSPAQPTASIPRQSEFGHKAWQAPGSTLPVSGAILGEVRGVTSTPPELFMWMGVGTGWVSLGGSGSQGPAGTAATISVGTVSTGAPGSSATVTNAGTSSAAVFNFSIPRGDVGAAGPQGETGATGAEGPQGPAGAAGVAATVTAGTTSTGSPGTSASVVNVGTTSAAVFDFTIPRGDVGATGPEGAQGPAGADGIPRTIQDEAVDLTQRLKVNFAGAGVTCVDNAGQSRTDCTIPGSSGGIGGTVGSVTDAVPVADGTGGNTLKASTVKITSGALIVPDGSETAPTIKFASYGTTGLYAMGAVGVGFTQNGVGRWMITNTSIQSQNGAHFYNQGAGNPVFMPGALDMDSGLGANASDDMAMYAGNGSVSRWLRVTAGVWRALDIGQAADTPQATTCADSGNASPGALMINPTTALVYVTNSDADGCAVTLGETNVTSGVRVEIVITASTGGAVAFSDASGVTELAGAFNAGLYDNLRLRYISDRWVEVGRSDN